MLALVDIPEYLNTLYESNKVLAEEIFNKLGESGERTLLKKSDNLLTSNTPSYVYIHKGFFKLFHEKKLVRFYSDKDIVLIERKQYSNDCMVTNDFASEVTIFDKNKFIKKVADQSETLEKWLTYQDQEHDIMFFLSSLYMQESVKPKMKIRNYAREDTIIHEGDEAHEIYEMIDGNAVVTVQGIEVGAIGRGEMFGEISLLTKEPRTATVTAKNGCMVHVISKDDFEQLVKYKPQTVYAIARILAKRVVELNKKLIDASS